MGFIDTVKARAKANKKSIVLPEGMDVRIYEAASKCIAEDIADITIIASPAEVEANNKGLDISNATIIDPATSEKTQSYAEKLAELRKSKGMTVEQAKELLLQEQIEAEQERTKEIEEYEKYTQTKKYIEEVAKDKLGLVHEGEIIFKEGN